MKLEPMRSATPAPPKLIQRTPLKRFSVVGHLLGTIGLVVGLAFSSPGYAQTVARGEPAPGVHWENFTVKDAPLNYNIMRINVSDPRVTLEAEPAKNSLFKGERVADMVSREKDARGGSGVVGGVNADFWTFDPRAYVTTGFLVSDGMIHTMPHSKRSAFVFTEDERSYIGPVTLNVAIAAGQEQISIGSINPAAPKKMTKPILFTPPYGANVGPLPGARYILEMNGSEFLPNKPLQVMVRPASAETTTPLKQGMLVLHVPEKQAKTVAAAFGRASSFTLSATVKQIQGVIRAAVGGGPMIAKDGAAFVNTKAEGISQKFADTRHPRTAIGYTKDQQNVFLVTVDGRQPKLSRGANLQELGEFMVQLGCERALNLDGGGSTTMVVGNKVVNSPSDAAGPRSVINSILAVTTPPGQMPPPASPGAGIPATAP